MLALPHHVKSDRNECREHPSNGRVNWKFGTQASTAERCGLQNRFVEIQDFLAEGLDVEAKSRAAIGQRFLECVAFADDGAFDAKRVRDVRVGMLLDDDGMVAIRASSIMIAGYTGIGRSMLWRRSSATMRAADAVVGLAERAGDSRRRRSRVD